MEKLIQLRTFRKEATNQFNELISNVRKDKDKSFPLAISSKPLVAIGGINYQNMDSVLSLGYETIAMSKGIFFKKDVENIIKNLNEKN